MINIAELILKPWSKLDFYAMKQICKILSFITMLENTTMHLCYVRTFITEL